MPALPPPQAIIFDMDGLMLDSEAIYQRAWQQALTGLGYACDAQTYLQLVGRSNRAAEQLMQARFGPSFPIESFREAWLDHWRHQVTNQGIPYKPGLLELLDLLECHAIPKAVGTSSHGQEAELSLKGLQSRFAHVVTVDQVTTGKPAPDIFLLAARKLGVPPSHCWVLEDSDAGVEAAAIANMTVIMVPDLQAPSAQSQQWAARIVDSLHDVCALIGQTV
jgi:beta-phosphoglucomutase-like phosphatase (HAD superfamily)